MNRIDYLNDLDRKLSSIDEPMRNAIIKQYEAIFDSGYEDSKSDEEIISGIGTSDFVADYYISTLEKESIVKSSENTLPSSGRRQSVKTDPNRPVGVSILRGIFVGFGLLLFNLVIVLGPYIAVWGILLGFFASGLALSIAGIAVALASLVSLPFALQIPLVLLSHPVLMFAFCAIFN